MSIKRLSRNERKETIHEWEKRDQLMNERRKLNMSKRNASKYE